MTPSSLIVVADRGSLKAYRVAETPTRGPSLQLVQAFDLTEAHGKLLDKVTDQAGRFPAIGRSNCKDCEERWRRRLVLRRASRDALGRGRSFTK
jgi:hypothetical protein